MNEAHSPDALARTALERLQAGEAEAARELLERALRLHPERPDLLHALGVTHLHLGESGPARVLIERAVHRAEEAARSEPGLATQAAAMVAGFRLTLATVLEDLDEPAEARAAFEAVLAANPAHADARAGLGHLLLAWGALDEGAATLRAVLADPDAPAELREGLGAYLADLDRFRAAGASPRTFLEAHRGAYVEFFDHHARRQEAEGWIAEAARMTRGPDGQLANLIPEGARPYAAVRVDLVDPRTSQVGQVGDQPMLVGLEAAPALAHAPALFPWAVAPFPAWVSSQCPWDHLPVQVLCADKTGAIAVDAVFADWYRAGFDGRFGTPHGQRFHQITEPALRRRGTGVVYHLDLGRAETRAIDDLVRRLTVFHEQFPLRGLVLGRGHLPG